MTEMATSERVVGCERMACRRQLKIDRNLRARAHNASRDFISRLSTAELPTLPKGHEKT